jgi:hypothetical protein
MPERWSRRRGAELETVFEGNAGMSHANRKTLARSTRDTERQQRHEMPTVAGATGRPDDHSPHAAVEHARKRLGKTQKHTSDDSPTA